MNLDNLKQNWEQEIKYMSIKPDFGQAIETLETGSLEFDKSIRRRDLIEISVSLFLIPFWILDLTKGGSVIGIVGNVVLILACIFIPYKLLKAKKITSNKITSIKSFLQTEKVKISNQMSLVESIVWWYIGPIFLGLILVTLGRNTNDVGLPFLEKGALIYLGTCLVGGIVIYFMNKIAARKKLLPMLEKVEAKLYELEEDLNA